MAKQVAIVIGQRGWTWVGYWTRVKGTRDILLKNARCIRQWGTDHGLAQIAVNGPTPKTVLDAPGDIVIYDVNIIARYKCDLDKWKKTLEYGFPLDD